jgi:hypothetical protein
MPSDISSALNQRGHKVTKEGSDSDVFLPTRQGLDAELVRSFKDILYNLMRQDSFRRSLRDWAYGNVRDGNANVPYIDSYGKLCEKFGGWSTTPEAIQNRYASTFEWYVSELLRREFAARASGFGLRLKDAHPDDEFDCVALLDTGLVFVECKTGRESIYSQIKTFLRRDAELGATYSFFVFDRDYTFRRTGDDVPELSSTQAFDLGVESILRITVGSHTFFRLNGQRWSGGGSGGRYFLACSAFNGFEDRIRYMIRYINESSERRLTPTLFIPKWINFTDATSNTPPAPPNYAGTTGEQGGGTTGAEPEAPQGT